MLFVSLGLALLVAHAVATIAMQERLLTRLIVIHDVTVATTQVTTLAILLAMIRAAGLALIVAAAFIDRRGSRQSDER